MTRFHLLRRSSLPRLHIHSYLQRHEQRIAALERQVRAPTSARPGLQELSSGIKGNKEGPGARTTLSSRRV